MCRGDALRGERIGEVVPDELPDPRSQHASAVLGAQALRGTDRLAEHRRGQARGDLGEEGAVGLRELVRTAGDVRQPARQRAAHARPEGDGNAVEALDGARWQPQYGARELGDQEGVDPGRVVEPSAVGAGTVHQHQVPGSDPRVVPSDADGGLTSSHEQDVEGLRVVPVDEPFGAGEADLRARRQCRDPHVTEVQDPQARAESGRPVGAALAAASQGRHVPEPGDLVRHRGSTSFGHTHASLLAQGGGVARPKKGD